VDLRHLRSTIPRWLRRVVAAVLLLVVAWGVFAVVFIANPTVNAPRHADAVVVLGPYLDGRVAQALQLAREYGIEKVVLSVGDTPGQIHGGYCAGGQPELHITCFVPDPFTTRGEAREIGKLAKAGDWKQVLVIAPTPQISRARMLIKRCYSGGLAMVKTHEKLDFHGWVHELIHQTAATVKAIVLRGC